MTVYVVSGEWWYSDRGPSTYAIFSTEALARAYCESDGDADMDWTITAFTIDQPDSERRVWSTPERRTK